MTPPNYPDYHLNPSKCDIRRCFTWYKRHPEKILPCFSIENLCWFSKIDFFFLLFLIILFLNSNNLFVIIHFEQQQHNNTQTNIYAAVIRSVDDTMSIYALANDHMFWFLPFIEEFFFLLFASTMVSWFFFSLWSSYRQLRKKKHFFSLRTQKKKNKSTSKNNHNIDIYIYYTLVLFQGR